MMEACIRQRAGIRFRALLRQEDSGETSEVSSVWSRYRRQTFENNAEAGSLGSTRSSERFLQMTTRRRSGRKRNRPSSLKCGRSGPLGFWRRHVARHTHDMSFGQSNGPRTLAVATGSSIIIGCPTPGTTWIPTPLALSRSGSGRSGMTFPVFPGNPFSP